MENKTNNYRLNSMVHKIIQDIEYKLSIYSKIEDVEDVQAFVNRLNTTNLTMWSTFDLLSQNDYDLINKIINDNFELFLTRAYRGNK